VLGEEELVAQSTAQPSQTSIIERQLFCFCPDARPTKPDEWVGERKREREREGGWESERRCGRVCVCVCVSECVCASDDALDSLYADTTVGGREFIKDCTQVCVRMYLCVLPTSE